jgi:hypothetical protein
MLREFNRAEISSLQTLTSFPHHFTRKFGCLFNNPHDFLSPFFTRELLAENIYDYYPLQNRFNFILKIYLDAVEKYVISSYHDNVAFFLISQSLLYGYKIQSSDDTEKTKIINSLTEFLVRMQNSMHVNAKKANTEALYKPLIYIDPKDSSELEPHDIKYFENFIAELCDTDRTQVPDKAQSAFYLKFKRSVLLAAKPYESLPEDCKKGSFSRDEVRFMLRMHPNCQDIHRSTYYKEIFKSYLKLYKPGSKDHKLFSLFYDNINEEEDFKTICHQLRSALFPLDPIGATTFYQESISYPLLKKITPDTPPKDANKDKIKSDLEKEPPSVNDESNPQKEKESPSGDDESDSQKEQTPLKDKLTTEKEKKEKKPDVEPEFSDEYNSSSNNRIRPPGNDQTIPPGIILLVILAILAIIGVIFYFKQKKRNH